MYRPSLPPDRYKVHYPDAMKTIIIIEDNALELKPLVDLFTRWQDEINILTAGEEEAAIQLMSQQSIDLVICDLHWPAQISLKKFSELTRKFPYIPSIAVIPGNADFADEIINNGAAKCIAKPIDDSELLLCADSLLNDTSLGAVKGLPVHSLLQMLESEKKSCTLQVDNNDTRGLLYVKEGRLINAETESLHGEKAACKIIGWQDSVMRIRFFNGQIKEQIDTPLIKLITTAFKEADQPTGGRKKRGSIQRHQLPLKHVPTLGKRIPLEIGSGVLLEFPDLESSQEGQVVGMIQDKCIIITVTDSLLNVSNLIESTKRVILKFTNSGRVWMLKTELLSTLDSPSFMLIFEYPGVIHFHELRKAKRRQIYIPCTIKLAGRMELYGALRDLSQSGGLCQLKHNEGQQPQINIHADVLLRCLLPGIKEEQKIQGKVRNMKVDKQETRLGIEFIDLQSHLIDIIGKYLYSIDSAHQPK